MRLTRVPVVNIKVWDSLPVLKVGCLLPGEFKDQWGCAWAPFPWSQKTQPVSPPCSARGAAPGPLLEREDTLRAEMGMLCTRAFPEGD